MYVCICRAVTEQQIEQAILDGARRMRDLRLQLGVCSSCGKCADCARQLLHQHGPAPSPNQPAPQP